MYAIRDIKSGEELFFDYRYPEHVTKNFWDKGEKFPSGGAEVKTTKAAVKQGQTVDTIEKPKKGRPPKHGGARTGAGRKARAIKDTSAPSGKQRKDLSALAAGDDATHQPTDEVEEADAADTDVDDDAASEVDPNALEETGSEDDSYHSATEDEGKKKSKPKAKVAEANPQKRGWVTRKENLRKKEELMRKRPSEFVARKGGCQ